VGPETAPVEPEKPPGETPAPDIKEVDPPQVEEAIPKLTPPPVELKEGPVTQTMASKSPLSGTPQRPAIPGLKGYCVMGLRDRKFTPARPEFSSIFDGRTYYFASSEAKAGFDAEPEKFALAYRGYDPVIWQTKQELVDGQFLREFQGQFYLFSTRENWETFKAAPQKFVLRKRSTSQSVVSR
jgi:YHS domain-containing protein